MEQGDWIDLKLAEKGEGVDILGRGEHKERSGGRNEHDVGQRWFLRTAQVSQALSLESSYICSSQPWWNIRKTHDTLKILKLKLNQDS